MYANHSSSGSSSRSSGSTLAVEPVRTSRNSAMDASRVGDDSAENGLSGEVGSAAVLKKLAANSCAGVMVSMPACSTPRSRSANPVSVASTAAARPRCSTCVSA